MMRTTFIYLLFILFSVNTALATGGETPGRPVRDIQQIILDHYVHFSTERVVFVDVNHQRMYVLSKNQILQDFQISTSKYGEGEVANSNKTPLGLHFVAKKIGENADMNTIFKSRSNTGKQAIPNDKRYEDKDLITTRIMWLEGGEERNSLGSASSLKRYIYIHGTPDEALLGKPASHGCVRMKNIDVFALYEFVDEGTPVIIWKDGYLVPDVIADLPDVSPKLSKKEQRKAEKRLKKEARGSGKL
jgi:hypothetical protein